MSRTFLFLQGVCSPFFASLADRLAADGHRVFKLNFNAGDALYWAPRKALHFRDRLENLPARLQSIYAKHEITDQILFGDRRPVHRPAVAHGEACGVRTHVFEEGYFRPHWVTLEREGVNGHSLLPREPDWFREVGMRLAEPKAVVPFASSFRYRAMHDVFYHTAGLFNPLFFPRYRTHAPYTAPVEYAGYVLRVSRLRLIRSREQLRAQEIIASKAPYFVLPLQLNSDAQIRYHSRFEDMGDALEYVLESFARHAAPDARMVVKNHPLDPGLVNHGRYLERITRRLDLDNRIVFLEDGDLTALLHHARGCVTVNSTSGLVALEQGTPTVTLSDPIYNLPGLTFQGGLDDFWRKGEKPDAELFCRFRRVVIRATQIDGGFYCQTGIALAVENSIPILTSEQSSLETLL